MMNLTILEFSWNIWCLPFNRYSRGRLPILNLPWKIRPTGDVKIEVIVKAQEKKPLAPSLITLLVNGKEVGRVTAERTVTALFTASESFDVGMDKGSGVAMEYHDKIPFIFNGKIHKINIKYID